MNYYIALWQDRHYDTTAHLFSDLQKAIQWARNTAKAYCNYEETYQEEKKEGWEFFVKYSYEDDCIWIVKTTLNR